MGVRGLTTYIAKNAEKYLVPFELHDCNLVIDGDNLASQLFNKTHNSCFGGNYDEYYKAVLHFFTLLRSCNVTPFVLMDGGYEERKMRTIKARLQTRITSVKYALPMSSKPVIPLFMREVFLDAVKMSKVPVMRCMFEADDEIAILARKLECPVLSYDSDFYIHNVMYIPYVTLTHKVYKKVMQDERNYEIEVIGSNKGKGKNKKKSNKKVVVVGKSKSVKSPEGDPEIETPVAYQYLDCCLYTIESLVGGKRALTKEMLPLFATLIGNDFIERRVFRKFYSHVRVKKGKKKTTAQQKRIKTIFEWLKNESLKSALQKVVGVMKLPDRERLIKQIKTAMDGYNNETSVAYEYFGFVDEVPEVSPGIEIDLESLLTGPETEEEDSLETEVEENEIAEDDESNDEEVSEEESASSDLELPEETPSQTVSPEITFPEWLQDKFMSGSMPRFIIDLYAGRRYVNYPQVEDLTLEDANSISYPILLRLYAILHHPNKPTLWYMTRITRYAKFYYKKFDATMIPDVNFNPVQKNQQQFHFVFEKFPLQILFNDIKNLPDGLRLYFLSIVYWMSQSKLTTSLHLHSVLLSVIAMYLIDRKFSVTHDEQKFLKGYRKLLEQLKSSTNTETCSEKDFPELNKSLTKHEAILVMEKLLTNFSINQKFERRHADFDRSVVHVFSELQSVCLFLHTLNALSNNPFPVIQMSQLFHGMFLYNTFVNLKSRTDPWKYIKEQIFKDTPNFMRYYCLMFEWCEKFLPNLANFDKQRIKIRVVKSRKINSNESARVTASKELAEKVTQNDCVEKRGKKEIKEDSQVATESNEEEEFVDLNNKFYQLLTV